MKGSTKPKQIHRISMHHKKLQYMQHFKSLLKSKVQEMTELIQGKYIASEPQYKPKCQTLSLTTPHCVKHISCYCTLQ